jgi:hypothetical protein
LKSTTSIDSNHNHDYERAKGAGLFGEINHVLESINDDERLWYEEIFLHIMTSHFQQSNLVLTLPRTPVSIFEEKPYKKLKTSCKIQTDKILCGFYR